MPKRVGIWIRVSTEDQVKGESPRHHEKRARMYAELQDWNVIEIYSLEAVSGKSVIEHPETQRMLKDIRRGHIEALVFSKIARLARNIRQLLEIGEVFQKYGADLVSLQESFDTATPSGRFVFFMIGAMAEWERDEIAERVRSSVPVRAKLGKSLGGAAPYGYKWVDQKLELHNDEAPVRKLLFELFAKHKRKRVVARMLNEKGHRTRKGYAFRGSTIDRLLRDPIAKGLRRVNYTRSTGEGKHWEMKPEDEWIFQPVPAIVSETLWDTCNKILSQMTTPKSKIRRKAVHLFSGVTVCHCGAKMYMRSNSPAYLCGKCRNKIKPDDLEAIFENELRDFVFSDTEIKKHLEHSKKRITEQEKLLAGHQKRITQLNTKIDQLFELYYAGEVDKDGFGKRHSPLNEELRQHEDSASEVQAMIDAIKMDSLSSDQIVYEARDLQSHWKDLTKEEKRTIIEAITDSITVGVEDIHIKLHYLPTLTADPKPLETDDQSNNGPKPPAPVLFLILKVLQKWSEPMSVRLLQSSGQGMCVRAWGCAEILEPHFWTSLG